MSEQIKLQFVYTCVFLITVQTTNCSRPVSNVYVIVGDAPTDVKIGTNLENFFNLDFTGQLSMTNISTGGVASGQGMHIQHSVAHFYT